VIIEAKIITKNLEYKFLITKDEYHNSQPDTYIFIQKFKYYTDSFNNSSLKMVLKDNYTIHLSGYKWYNIKLQLINGIMMDDESIIINDIKIKKHNTNNYYNSDSINVEFDLNNNSKIITTVFISKYITALIKSKTIKLKFIILNLIL